MCAVCTGSHVSKRDLSTELTLTHSKNPLELRDWFD
jgi:hypothetical protein